MANFNNWLRLTQSDKAGLLSLSVFGSEIAFIEQNNSPTRQRAVTNTRIWVSCICNWTGLAHWPNRLDQHSVQIGQNPQRSRKSVNPT